jgi:NAD-dependent deacetylase sirtuin 4
LSPTARPLRSLNPIKSELHLNGYSKMKQLNELATLLQTRKTVVLTGAGCSTESGIPDYRGPETRHKAKNPIKFQSFINDEAARRRYWSRSFIGWPKFRSASPNTGHSALARLEESGYINGVLTQNVDGLHQMAGSKKVVELHGNLERVICLQCGTREDRNKLQERLQNLNPTWKLYATELLPDGDAELNATTTFRVADCLQCGGALKPDVVFFGENLQPQTRKTSEELFSEAEALLVVGSSLAVFSGYRFVYHAAQRGLPVAAINLDDMMRGEDLVSIRINARAGEALSTLVTALAR